MNISDYRWYHCIPLPDGTETPGAVEYKQNWQFIGEQLLKHDLKNKAVADIGCRDGFFSFLAEEMGAGVVWAFDNDINPGSEVVADLRGSMVKFEQVNLYSFGLFSSFQAQFDVVLFFGVLYHLRYPIWGLKCVLETLRPGGTLLIETALYTVPSDHELIYCPVKNSPYESTSCSFFNQAALVITLSSLGAEVISVVPQSFGANDRVARFFITVKKVCEMPEAHRNYWEGTHKFHSGLENMVHDARR